jgi:hypothetical protein
VRTTRLLAPLGLLALLCSLGWQPAAPTASAEDARTETISPDVAWRLGRSDLVQYERVSVRTHGDRETRSSKRLVTIQGHDLITPESARGHGQYAPLSPELGDLPQLLAFRLTRPAESTSRFKLDWVPGHVTNLRIRGSVKITREVDGETHLEGNFDFKSRGKALQDDRWALVDGKAKTQVVWSVEQGVVQSSRIEVSYKRRNLQEKAGSARKSIERVYEYTLQGIHRMRAEDRQARVQASIEKGIAYLRTLQESDGSFKPYQEWRIGSTALAILALVSSGISRDDKQVKRALDWLFHQEPEKTYERAAALMAIDRAYTPESELEAIRQGHVVETPKRELPAERRAWVIGVAEDLMHSAPSPGTWGYPTGSDVRMKSDLSNTQYAVLGLRSAAHLGFKPKDGMGREDVDAWADLWMGVLRTCRGLQARQGPKGTLSLVLHGQAIPDERSAHELYVVPVPKVAGFRYATVAGNDHVSGSMTCAGITCLLVARHELLLIDCARLSEKLAKEVEDLLNGAWAWLDQHWAMDRHPEHPENRWYYYYLYCLERAGILGNVKRIGGKDWYFEGAEQLIARQLENGSWNDPVLSAQGDGGDGPWSDSRQKEVPSTCFALLFLQRGTAPLAGQITCK